MTRATLSFGVIKNAKKRSLSVTFLGDPRSGMTAISLIEKLIVGKRDITRRVRHVLTRVTSSSSRDELCDLAESWPILLASATCGGP